MLANLFDGKLIQVVGVKNLRLYFFGFLSVENCSFLRVKTNKYDFVIHYKTELHWYWLQKMVAILWVTTLLTLSILSS